MAYDVVHNCYGKNLVEMVTGKIRKYIKYHPRNTLKKEMKHPTFEVNMIERRIVL